MGFENPNVTLQEDETETLLTVVSNPLLVREPATREHPAPLVEALPNQLGLFTKRRHPDPHGGLNLGIIDRIPGSAVYREAKPCARRTILQEGHLWLIAEVTDKLTAIS